MRRLSVLALSAALVCPAELSFAKKKTGTADSTRARAAEVLRCAPKEPDYHQPFLLRFAAELASNLTTDLRTPNAPDLPYADAGLKAEARKVYRMIRMATDNLDVVLSRMESVWGGHANWNTYKALTQKSLEPYSALLKKIESGKATPQDLKEFETLDADAIYTLLIKLIFTGNMQQCLGMGGMMAEARSEP